LDCQADRTLRTPYSSAMLSILRYSRNYFKVMYRFSSTVSLGGIPPLLCNVSRSFWSIESITYRILSRTAA
jgi:hypothetical protein